MTRVAHALTLATSILAAAPLAGCLSMDTGGGQDVPEVLDVVTSPVVAGEKPRGGYVVIPPKYAQAADEAPTTTVLPHAGWIIYMNKNGGTFTPGNNDSRTNRSSIPNQTSTIAPWNVTDAAWQQVMTCVKAQFAPFDVEVTDVDPGQVPHIESVVAGNPQDVGMQQGVGGVSPFTSDCSTIPNSIVFTFAEVFGNDYQTVCEVVAQEVSHSFGLDHEYLCSDPMTYLTGCGSKSFQNMDVPCGEYSARTCACGQSTQNSVAMLSARIGVGGDTTPPTVTIQSPADGATVAPGFTVSVDATDDNAVSRVELYIDGTLAATDDTAPFSFVTDAGMVLGTHQLETRAYDAKNVGSSTITVTVDQNADPSNPNDPSNPSDPNNPNNPSGQNPSDLVGGCQSGGSSSGATAMFVLFLGLVFAGRRRAH